VLLQELSIYRTANIKREKITELRTYPSIIIISYILKEMPDMCWNIHRPHILTNITLTILLMQDYNFVCCIFKKTLFTLKVIHWLRAKYITIFARFKYIDISNRRYLIYVCMQIMIQRNLHVMLQKLC